MKRYWICTKVGLKIEDTMNNTSTTAWATVMNILYVIKGGEYNLGVFIFTRVEKSLSTIRHRTLKQNCTGPKSIEVGESGQTEIHVKYKMPQHY